MTRIGSLPPRMSATWTYALIGGIASIPLTIALYWLSGMGSDFSLNMVFVGGLLAGYLARTASTELDTSGVGFRAGVVGGLPGLWFLFEILRAATALGGPLWFRVAATSIVVGYVTTLLLGFAGFVGLVGAKVGGWVAKKTGPHRPLPVEN